MLRNLFSPKKYIGKQKVIIVSGLPRSGTSMMMKMLAEGGLPVVTDSLRQADKDNPNGYFEIEQSKRLKDGKKKWVYAASGKAVKVVSYFLEYLPDGLTYDVIFMERKIAEVLDSQKKMLHHRNEHSSISDDEMTIQLQQHLKAVRYWVARKPNMRVIYIDYSEMVKAPQPLCTSLVEFLEISLNVRAMQTVPTRSLYRNRS